MRFIAGTLATGSETLAAVATDLTGNTTTTTPTALAITYTSGVFTSTTTRTVSDTTPVIIGGSGTDTIVLNISEDAYRGDAQFTVSIDGVQIGGIQTATALHSAGQSQDFTLQGNFGAGPHVVTVNFVNDAFAVYSDGSVAGDRNLYVNAITGDGVTTVENSYQNLQGAVSYNLALPTTTPTPTTPTTPTPTALAITYTSGVFTSTTTRTVSDTTPVIIGGSGTDTILLNISEDTYRGDAQFTVSVDGVQIGGIQTATALHSAGQSQDFTLQGNFGAGPHVVTVNFVNDAVAVYSDGSVAGDRNLYVNAITGDGFTTVENSYQNLQGAVSYNLDVPTASIPPAPPPAPPPTPTAPSIAITSQTLANDTGTSATDNITNDGAVTLTGVVTGATGTTVTILDGNNTLGTATISNGSWSFTTTLGSGTHSLQAIATDPSNNIATSAAEPAITVDFAPPVITIATSQEISGSTAYILSGTVTDSTATTLQITDNGQLLGSATVSNGNWSFTTGALATGSQTLAAVATDLAGNTATAADPLTVSVPSTSSSSVISTPDMVLATVSTGSGITQQDITLSSAAGIHGTYVPTSTSGIGANSLVLYNWNPATQLQGFLAAEAAGAASIIGTGDSWTSGFGSAATGWTQLSYLNEMTQALNADGIAAQSDNFLGSQFYISNGEVDDNRLTPIGYANSTTAYDGGWAIVAGGNAIYLDGAGKGFNFQLDTPGNYDEVTLSYIDTGSGSVSLNVDGVQVGTMTFGNTGQTLSQTIRIPAGAHSNLVVESTSGSPVYIQGASFGSTTHPAIQVYNGGIGGWDSSSSNTSIFNGQALTGSGNGYGQTASAAALHPSLAVVNLGINDIANSEDTVAQTLANVEQIVATLRAAGTDVIIMIPAPFGGSNYATDLPELRAGLQAYSLTSNVPLIDLSATYGNDVTGLVDAGLMSDLLHGDATFYADIGSQLASLLTKTISDSATITLGTGAQTLVLTSADETVNATASGAALIQGSAAEAGALINGNGSTVLEIIDSGGTAVLNAGDTGLTVKLDGATNLILNAMQFVNADGSAGGSTITAGAANQTLLGGPGDTLIGATAYGDLFKGSSALLNNDFIENFGGSDQIDLTDMLSSNVTGLSWTANSTGGVLSLTDGTHKTALDLPGSSTTGSFIFKSDGAGGTLIGLS